MKSKAYKEGLKVRTEVMTKKYVDNVTTHEFSAPFQEYVTECSWGKIWTRPGLDRRTRFLCNLAVLTVLGGKSYELGVHIRAALHNGCTKEEIQEVFLQMAIYAGIFNANSAFQIANSIFEAEEGQ
jgi:alkylhydroperoxidase/carboxymuconolactone decarboxylase family protein YurZ